MDGGDAGLAGERVESFGFHIGSLGEQQLGDAFLSAEGGVVERRQLQTIAGVDIGAFFNEQVRHRFRSEQRHEMQGRFAPGFFFRVQIRAVLDEQFRIVPLRQLRGEVQGGEGFAVSRVDVGALFDEVARHFGESPVDRPVQGGALEPVLRVDVRARLEQSFHLRQVAQLGGLVQVGRLFRRAGGQEDQGAQYPFQ